MKIADRFKNFIDNNKLAKAIYTDKSNKAVFLTSLKIVVDLAQLIIQVVAFIISPSFWYGTLAALYLTYLLTKLSIVLTRLKDKILTMQGTVYRNTGIMTMLTILPFSGSIVLIYLTGTVFSSAGVLIFANAFWAFFKITTSTVNFIKDRKHDNNYLKSIRNINLANALVSITTLQVAMFSSFDAPANSKPYNGITGGVVSALIMTLSIVMIIKGCRYNVKKDTSRIIG